MESESGSETVTVRLSTALPEQLLEAASQLLDAFTRRPVPGSGLACMEQAALLGDLADAVERALAPLVGRVDLTGQAKIHGFSGTRAWLATGLGTRNAVASDRLALARTLHRLPDVAERFAEHRLPAGHAAAICHAVKRLDDTRTPKAERILLGLAESGGTVEQVRRAGERIVEAVRGDGPDGDTRKGYDASWLEVTDSLDGGAWVKGWFDPELKQVLQSKLDPLTSRTASAGAGTRDKRNAAALRTLLTRDGRGQEAVVVITLRDTQVRDTEEGDSPGACMPLGGRPASWGSLPSPATSASPVGSPLRAVPSAPGGTPVPRGTAAADSAGEVDNGGSVSHPGGVTRLPRRADPTSISAHGAAESTDEAGPPPTYVFSTDRPPRSRTGVDTGTSGPVREPGFTAGSDSGVSPDSGAVLGIGAVNKPENAGRWQIADARLADGTPVSAAQAKRIALNHGVSLLLLSGEGKPLYLGNKIRFASDAQRKVLAVRYSSCAVDECDIPARACEVDHVEGWEFGGPTDIGNLAVVCGFHNRHKADHPGAYEIVRHRDGTMVYRIIRPPWMRKHAA
ncbi:HNH endonuclease signature motif containing protein [Rhizohabitans arisaemae]|uniref:HNH endonuclease signature motif containing protein n=1 Tax=Rhizohabitans arisaemae TaxID=2720610 RepID=UPI0024B0ACDE|nr:HNH endonuclease [Rhizohabitans arisaemae]